jgi:hypothetical protein
MSLEEGGGKTKKKCRGNGRKIVKEERKKISIK